MMETTTRAALLLRAWREERGLQDFEAAHMFGIREQTYRRYERGGLPTLANAAKIEQGTRGDRCNECGSPEQGVPFGAWLELVEIPAEERAAS